MDQSGFQGSGRIVNISSVGGRVFSPFRAWYHATKHALEGWSDCLRLETAPFNIQVVLVEPGLIKTDFGDVAGAELSKYGGNSAYRSQLEPLIKARGEALIEVTAKPHTGCAKFTRRYGLAAQRWVNSEIGGLLALS